MRRESGFEEAHHHHCFDGRVLGFLRPAGLLILAIGCFVVFDARLILGQVRGRQYIGYHAKTATTGEE